MGWRRWRAQISLKIHPPVAQGDDDEDDYDDYDSDGGGWWPWSIGIVMVVAMVGVEEEGEVEKVAGNSSKCSSWWW